MALLINTNNEVSTLDDLSLESLQTTVGGYIEIVRSKDGKTLFVCNEEGKLLNLEPNTAATRLAYKIGALPASDYFCGNVIVAKSNEIK